MFVFADTRTPSLALLITLVAGCGLGSGRSADGEANADSSLSGPSSDSAQVRAFDEFVETSLATTHVPGISVAIVKNGAVAFAKGYGTARREDGTAMTKDSIINAASISKAVTAVSFMRLVDEGKVNLDDDVQDIIGHPLRNPAFADVAITPRMLLTHTSSIDSKSDAIGNLLDSTWVDDGDATVSLEEIVSEGLSPGGKYYDTKTFHPKAPGTFYDYCNVCPAVTALVIEKVTGQKFDTWSERNILHPLGMTASTWRLANTDRSKLANGYYWEGGRLEPVPHAGAAYYPATTLRTTATDLAKLLIEMTTGHRVLGADTAKSMLTVQFPTVDRTQGLGFYLEKPSVFGHTGSYAGHAANFAIRTTDDVGVVLLTNGDAESDQEPFIEKVESKLWDLSASL